VELKIGVWAAVEDMDDELARASEIQLAKVDKKREEERTLKWMRVAQRAEQVYVCVCMYVYIYTHTHEMDARRTACRAGTQLALLFTGATVQILTQKALRC